MTVNIRAAVVLAILTAAVPAAAETVTCPPLATAQQVGSCPNEEELKIGFTGYCSDNQRMYDREDTCIAFEKYKALKDVALWETQDGAFQGYLPCGGDQSALKALMPEKAAVSKLGSITKLTCIYPGDITLSRRGKGACTITEKTTANCE
jgi:hypothetical protein